MAARGDSLQDEESGTGALIAAIIAVSVRTLAADAAQQAAHHAHQNQQQRRADGQQGVVNVNVVLLDVIIGSVEVLGHGARLRNAAQRARYLVGDIPHSRAFVCTMFYDE